MKKPSGFRRLAVILTLVSAAPLLAGAADAPNDFKKDVRKPVDITKEKALYVVGYAHLDTQWRWAYPQVIREFIANTLRNNFALFSKYPNYVFNFSGSRRYEMMKEYYPAEYETLKGYVAAGRWFPCGSSVDEGDAVVPSLESMVRHILYGNRYFEREFGVTSREFMLPDCFGFPSSLPSVLAHCGIQGFSTQKLTWGSAVGIPFKVGTWTGPDGAKVIAALDPGSYGGMVTDDLSQSKVWLDRINKTGDASGAFVDYHYFGVGDQGGAPSEKSVKWIERSVAGSGPVRVISARADSMFAEIKPENAAKLPNYKGELLLTNHSAGAINSQAYMKRWNRKSELLATAAERASVAALWLGGAPYPARKIYNAWDLVLGSQMHDMLPGTSLPKAYEFCWNDYILAQNQFAAVESDAAGAVISALDTQAQGIPVVVYNALATERDDLVEAGLQFPGAAPEAVRVIGPDGKETPAQINRREGNTAQVVFLAHVPAIGFACYDIQAAESSIPTAALKISESARTLENARYRVTINEAGDVASIFDKSNSQELLSAPARLSFQHEKPKQYPAWNMDWEDRNKPSRAYVEGPAKIRAVESGAARVALEIQRESQGSRFVQQVRLGAGGAGEVVEVVNKIDWMTRESSLKATFPLAVSNPLATYDDKVGTDTRGNNEPKRFEVPQQGWFDLTDTGGRYGVAVLNDCKYGSDKPADNLVRLTLIYTPGVRGSYQDQASQDLGRHDISYAIAGHAGDWKQGGVARQGARFNQPLVAFQSKPHRGKLGRSFEFLKVTGDHVEVAAVKKAEEGDGIVVRLRELNGESAKGVRVCAAGKIVAAREIDGQEHALKSAQVTLDKGELVTEIPAYGLRAFALKLAPSVSLAAAPKSQALELAYDLDAFSSDASRADGGFDSDGRTYPAEQMPGELVSEGISFKMGPVADGKKSAVICRGQSLALPPGDFNRVYLLAAAVNGDAKGVFKVGDGKVEQTVQDWNHFIGSWDNRLWSGTVPELAYNWNNSLAGLVPGFTKRDTVAWYASHRHHPKGGNEFYSYCYLFKYGFDVAPGTRSLTLPDNDKIRVFAVTMAKNNHDDAIAAQSLYDTLADHVADAPLFAPAGGKFSETTPVAITALYWHEGALHYTLDGSEPTAASPVYSTPLLINANTNIKARMIGSDGQISPMATAKFEVNDVTAPVLKSVESLLPATQLILDFSEPVTVSSAEAVANYRVEPSNPVVAAKLSEDGKRVRLTLAAPMATQSKLTAIGVTDRSPAANRVTERAVSVKPMRQVYSLASLACDGNTSRQFSPQGLPVKAGDAWTINLFVRTGEPLENRTLIAGFGSPRDQAGKGRYLAKFANGVHFWSSSRDGETRSALEAGKWQMLSATYDGQLLTIYKNAKKIGEQQLKFEDDDSVVHLAPIDPWDKKRRFKGELRDVSVWDSAISAGGVQELLKSMPQ